MAGVFHKGAGFRQKEGGGMALASKETPTRPPCPPHTLPLRVLRFEREKIQLPVERAWWASDVLKE